MAARGSQSSENGQAAAFGPGYYTNMNSHSNLQPRLFLSGLAIWFLATIALRFAGHHALRPDHPPIFLFAISFPFMAWLARRLCRRFHVPPELWLAGSVSLALPTLLLDPFSSAFFPLLFPNIAPEMAGVFGGWMLWCCAGAISGGIIGRSSRPVTPDATEPSSR
jgi:uncharacterized protein DUF5367